jgi:hypothetical protein
MINQTQVMETLSYLLGENNVPTSSVAVSRKNPWNFSKETATLNFSSGLATLPATFDAQHKIYAYFYNGDTQTELREINIGDSDMYMDLDYKFWVEHVGDGMYAVKTKDTNYTTAVVAYQTVAPTINATVYTPFPDQMTVALGARRYVKLGQNPDADISQDEALFQKRLNENIAASQVNRPLRKHRSVYRANNYRVGEG